MTTPAAPEPLALPADAAAASSAAASGQVPVDVVAPEFLGLVDADSSALPAVVPVPPAVAPVSPAVVAAVAPVSPAVVAAVAPVSPAVRIRGSAAVPPKVAASPTVAAGGSDGWDRGAAAYPPGYGRPSIPPGAVPTFDPPGYAFPNAPWPQVPPLFDGPKAWPVAVFTVFFGIFGAISAARRAGDARALGLPVGRYWGVFVGALVGSFAIWTLVFGLFVAIELPAYLKSVSTIMTTTQLEQELEASSAAGVAVNDAACTEESVDPDGTGFYECQIAFDDGENLAYRITVNDDGTWSETPVN
ncbi:hypothetical protein [Cryptosporangium sp. NPDC051539]|uniref:hypothetical protein n=1 Tax=Cryptosporangium sp. NPDC051539 TaxID=3363962 RepID=UPI00379301CA